MRDGGRGARVGGPGRARRRVGPLAVAVAVLAAGAAAVVRVASPSAAATPSPGTTASPAIVLHAVHGASYLPALEGQRPLYILALGSDARPGQDVTHGSHSDSIHLIGVNLRTHHATLLGFPRDAWVNVPGVGMAKLTTAMFYGGPNLVVQVIRQITGITPDFYAVTSFPGLVNMVNGIGGLTVRVQVPMYDPYSGADFSTGIHRFDGQQALSFARDRHTFANGDFSRSGDQGILLLSALRKLDAAFAKDPAAILGWLSVFWRNIWTDLPPPTLVRLAFAATEIPPANVNNVVVPGTGGIVGNQDVVFLAPQAQALYASMRATGTAPGSFTPVG